LSPPFVKEVEAVLFMTEPLDFVRVAHHLSMWQADLDSNLGAAKLEQLMAMHTVQEVNMLISTLDRVASGNRSRVVDASVPVPEAVRGLGGRLDPMSGNDLAGDRKKRRQKRNILGDVLHAITGLATDEQLQQQLQLDKEIRDRVSTTLARQVTFEKSLAESMASVHQEEETMEAQILELRSAHDRDLGRATRLMVNRHMIQEDVDKLEDVLHAVWTGTANARHSTYLSSRAGLQQVAAFHYVNCTKIENGVVITYTSRLYSTSAVLSVQDLGLGTYRALETVDRLYYLHSSHHLSMPLTEKEVRGFRSSCPECAILVYLGHDEYLTVVPGAVSCTLGGKIASVNLTVSSSVLLAGQDSCANSVMQTGGGSLRTKLYRVDTAEDRVLDSLLVQKAASAGSDVETLAHMKRSHERAALSLKHDLGAAQVEMRGLVEDTDKQFFFHEMQSYASWAWLLIITVVILCALFLVCARYRAAKRSVAAAVVNATV
jgi:hypothetical protein